MKKWKVGDRVVLNNNIYGDSPSNPFIDQTEGTIREVDDPSFYGQNIVVDWLNGSHNCYYSSDLKEVEENIIDVDELFSEIDI